jgi:hypothetical protein
MENHSQGINRGGARARAEKLAMMSGLKTLLQLTSVTKSFRAVPAFKGVSFDLRACAPGQPGGLPDISRGLSAATPPEPVRKTARIPEGCQNRSTLASRNGSSEPLAPLRGGFVFRASAGGVVALHAPQPPANFFETSGLVLPRIIQHGDYT